VFFTSFGGGVCFDSEYKTAPVFSFGLGIFSVYLDCAISLGGSVSENTYGKGYLTDKTSCFQFNAGPLFSILDNKLKIAPIIGLSSFKNPYSDLYYDEIAYGNKVTRFNCGGALSFDFGKMISFGVQGTNHGCNLNLVLFYR
jgi:hypothetical protein